MKFNQKDFSNKSIKDYLTNKESFDDNQSGLQEFLYSLITIYEYNDKGESLYACIQKDWKLFQTDASCKKVLDEIIHSDETTFDRNGIKDSETLVEYKKDITDCVQVWEELKDDIKNHHRFTTDLKKLDDAGWKKFLDNRYLIDPNDSFYRARIHYKKSEIFGLNDMGAREKGDCPPGRANPEGIPFLYLSEEPKTTFFETRVNLHDIVSVGEFKLTNNEPLYVEDLTDIDLDRIDLFDEDIVTLAKRKLLIRTLSMEMSHPMRRFDSLIEYVPTQFICEYVQLTQTVSGIRFSSSVYPQGTNVVIFNPNLMQCIAVKDYNIGDLDIKEAII